MPEETNINKCLDIDTPQPDNTDLPCDEFTDGDCIVLQNLSDNVKTYYNLGETPTLTEYANAIGQSLIDARQRIVTLENQP